MCKAYYEKGINMKKFRRVMKLLWVKETAIMFLFYLFSFTFIGLGVAMSQAEDVGLHLFAVMMYGAGFICAVIGWAVGRYGVG